MEFEGGMLQRGFWIYIWRITNISGEWLYVGRTGDSSSSNAGSPFTRIGQHLNFRPNAKGNSMLKQLKKANVDIISSKFEMIAVGPIFDEQKDFDSHKPIRDIISAIEKAIALILCHRNYKVLGIHQSTSALDSSILNLVIEKIDKYFPNKHINAT